MSNRIFGLFVLFMLPFFQVKAQETFEEGTITYNVKISNPNGSSLAGTYVLSLKGSNVRKELKLEDGYQTIMLLNSRRHTIYSLKESAQNKLAIQLNFNDYSKQQSEYEQAKLNKQSGDYAINGIKASKAILQYKNGYSTEILLATEWKLNQKYAIDRMESLEYIPVSFEYKNEEGVIIRFTIKEIAEGPVASSLFRVPTDYKIINNDEYKQLEQ